MKIVVSAVLIFNLSTEALGFKDESQCIARFLANFFGSSVGLAQKNEKLHFRDYPPEIINSTKDTNLLSEHLVLILYFNLVDNCC